MYIFLFFILKFTIYSKLKYAMVSAMNMQQNRQRIATSEALSKLEGVKMGYVNHFNNWIGYF